MSCQITLSTWSGESKTEAAEKLSRIFRLNKEKGLIAVEGLCVGLPWRFENNISDKQASQAAKFLQEIGFSVDILPVEGNVESLPVPLPESETTETSTPAEKVSTGAAILLNPVGAAFWLIDKVVSTGVDKTINK